MRRNARIERNLFGVDKRIETFDLIRQSSLLTWWRALQLGLQSGTFLCKLINFISVRLTLGRYGHVELSLRCGRVEMP